MTKAIRKTSSPAITAWCLRPFKFTLRHVPINYQGYTSTGQYYGIGQRLYQADATDCTHVNFDDGERGPYFEFRACDREAAKAHIRKQYPNARFYN